MEHPLRIALFTFVAGGLGGALLDQAHLHGGVLTYPAGDWQVLGQPWWVAPQFGLLLVLLMFGITLRVVRACGRRVARTTLAADAVLLLGGYALTIVLVDSQPLLVLALSGITLGRWAIARWSAPEVLVIVTLATFGPAWEALLVHAGVFSYTNGTFFGLAPGLPALYLVAGSFVLTAASAMAHGFRSCRNGKLPVESVLH